MLEYSPEKLELFVDLASERRRRELLELANATAVGAATGFTGSTKPLEAYERALLGRAAGAGSAIQRDLQSRLKQMARAAGVKLPRPGEAARARERAAREGRRGV